MSLPETPSGAKISANPGWYYMDHILADYGIQVTELAEELEPWGVKTEQLF